MTLRAETLGMVPSTRRQFVGGLGAVALSGSVSARDDDNATARIALDEARSLPPAAAMRRLAGVTATGLAPQLDLGAARAGLAVDMMLSRFGPPEAQRSRLAEGSAAGRPGAVNLPDGERWYALQLRRQLGDGIDPRGAEARLTAMLGQLHRRAEPLFAAIGLDRGGIGERYARLWTDPAYLYEDSAAGRDQAVADMSAVLAGIRPGVAALVGPVPAASLDVTVRRLSPAEEAAGRGGYRDLPTRDHPGAYIVDLKDIRRRPRWTLPSVVAHELLPGHMVQLPIEALTPPHPLRIDYTTGFSEGWGIYAETLCANRFGDPRVMLGHIHWLLFRVGRGLVDLGIHLHGWTLADAQARLVSWQGMPAYFAPFVADVQRMAIEPGTRAAEALVWIGLADRAAHLTSAARVRFHQGVLAGGRKRLEQLTSVHG